MQTLGMAGGRFLIESRQLATTEPAPHGVDQIEFRVTANPGQPLRPLAKVASGGELVAPVAGRAGGLLARKTRAAWCSTKWIPASAARSPRSSGRELQGARRFSGQVLCVTHLPQVAARVITICASRSSPTARPRAPRFPSSPWTSASKKLARMLGGIEITGKAREHAREMLQMARQARIRRRRSAQAQGLGRSETLSCA